MTARMPCQSDGSRAGPGGIDASDLGAILGEEFHQDVVGCRVVVLAWFEHDQWSIQAARQLRYFVPMRVIHERAGTWRRHVDDE